MTKQHRPASSGLPTHARRPNPLQRSLVAASVGTSMLLAAPLVQAQGLVSPCTGISLPRSSIFNYLDPVLGPLLGTVNTLTAGTLGLGGIYGNLSSGQPLALNLLDTQGNLLSASDGCKLTGDAYSLNTDAGIAIGGNAVTGLGTEGGVKAFAGAKNAVAIGDGASTASGAPDAVALGAGASVLGGAGSIALGAGSIATGVLEAPYVPQQSGYTVAGTGAGANRELSIGTDGNERRITHVAAGGADTDAVNVSQLKAVSSVGDTLTTNLTNLSNSIDNGTIGLVQQQGGAPGNGIIFVGASTGGSVVDFSGTAGARILSGVAAGVAATDAVNLGQLNAVAGTAANAVQYDAGSKVSVTLGGVTSTDGGVTAGTRISNVAQGALSATSTDAVNGAQLQATNQTVALNTANVGALTSALGGGAAVQPDGSVSGPTYTLNNIGGGGTSSVATYNNVGDALGALGGSVTQLNQTVNTIAGGSAMKYLQVNSNKSGALAAASDSLALGPAASALAVGAVAIGSGAVAGREGMNGQSELFSGTGVASTQGAVSIGTAGGERQLINVAGGTEATDAVNVRQLRAVQAGGVSYGSNPDGTPNYTQVTLGNGQAPQGTVLSNVAPGTAPTDAVNVQQLGSGVASAVQQAGAYTDARVTNLQVGIQEVARKSYAGVAAAMAMESAPYVPGKLSYAAGMGVYESQTAVGVSLRHTAPDGRWSITGGVSATGSGGVAARFGFAGVF
ncbi:MAG: hypothetical protein EOP80_00190 [Variovorax sp.]|nr:MAG: hypothetical protein EOP80_00190 [Variovorax sp.]